MGTEVARQYRLEYSSTLGSPLTISSITKANPAVVTSSAHGLQNGDYVLIRAEGMLEVDYLVAKVSDVDTDTFKLSGIDSSNYGTFTSGTAQKITFATFARATAIDFGQGTRETSDETVLLDAKQRLAPGQMTAAPITVELFTDLTEADQAAVNDAAYEGETLAWRATRKSGKVRVWAGMPSDIGEVVRVGQTISGSFTIINQSPRIVNYTS